jgi:hypothetical protein
MAPRAKRAFDAAARAADRRRSPSIGAVGLLHAVLGIDDGLACELLVLMGVDVAGVRDALAPG